VSGTRLIAVLAVLNLVWSPVNLLLSLALRDGATPTAIAAIRWGLLGIVIGVCLCIPGFRRLTNARWPSRRDAVTAFLLGISLFGPSHALYYYAIGKTSSFEGTVLGTTAPIWVAMLAWIFLRERPTSHRLAAIALGFVGAWIVSVGFALPRMESGHTYGNSLYLGAVLMESICGVWAIQLVRRSSGITILFLQVLGAGLFLNTAPWIAPGIFPFDVSQTGTTTLAVLIYLIFFSGLFTFTVWYTLSERVPLSLMVVTLMMQPPLATILGVTFLGETVTPQVLVGTALIFAALAFGAADARSARVATDEVASH